MHEQKSKGNKAVPETNLVIKNANKQKVKRTLRNFRRSNSMEDRARYVELRKQYRKLFTRKSDCYKTEMKNKLINSAKDPKTFWSTLKKSLLRKE